ncbi:MAG TPA: DUF2905 family protein [Acidimicrobiales bacterium]|nr:DUF2905 family protein [Acidimicrobiales bacterium]
MQWLLPSIVLSVVLTIVLNVLVRAFPGGAHRVARRVDQWAAAPGPRVRVFFPWRSMLLASVVLTILVNVFGRR